MNHSFPTRRSSDLDEGLGAEVFYDESPADLKEQAAEWRQKMIDAALEMDDAALEAYLEGNEPDDKTLTACIRKGTIAGKFVPVLCGSAFKNKGVQPLLDAVVDYLPSPVDVEIGRASCRERVCQYV